jgi:radical SAM protein with 4Fe4S-binding SPASM domain
VADLSSRGSENFVPTPHHRGFVGPDFQALEVPNHVDIDLSSQCNLRCRFCHLNFFAPPESTSLTYEQFLHLEPLLPHLESMTLFGKYEPLVCKDFLKIFDKICEYPIESYFSTNGIKLTRDIAESLVGRLKYLTVSITGFTPETYKRSMGARQLDRVKENLRVLNELKKAQGTELPILRISTVAMQDTLDEIKLALDFVKEFDATEGLQVTSFKAHADHLTHLMPLADIERYREFCRTAYAYADEIGVKCDLQSGDVESNEQQTSDLGHRYCDMPWHRLSLQANGDVFSCPVSYEPIGNFLETPIFDIWRGEVLAKFRKGVNDPENMNDDCKNCTHCRHRSLLNPEANDFSQAERYIAGMTRI